FEMEQVIDEDWFAFEPVEGVSAKATAKSHDHSLGAAFRNGDLGSDRVILIEDARSATVRNAGVLTRKCENGSAGGRTRSRRDEAGQNRIVQRQDLVLRRLRKEQRL